VSNRDDVLLVRFQRLHDGAELEVGARAGRSPLVHLRTMGGVSHDRAVRNVEEPRPQLPGCRGLRQGSGGRDHCIQQRQGHADPRTFEKRPAGKMFLTYEHVESPTSRISNWTNPAPQIRDPKFLIGRVQFSISDFGFEMQDSSNFKFPHLTACIRKASLVTMPETMADSR